ncbi:hypothetical protein TWF696_003511 [Orbilia brochopaga]|uniref:Uncharacterized protein n=1 Tax=Orbilia brochopaga TaxID=3140254 RepID=A0AAV9TXY2_9PEZI
MPSVLDKWVQDYKPLKQWPPVIPTNPQRTAPPAPFCVHCIRANYQGEQSFRGKKYFPATCDKALMREAVMFVSTMVNTFLKAWLEAGKEEMPAWYTWYYDFLQELHHGRFWRYEHPPRWHCAEIAAALDEKFSSLRWTQTMWIHPAELQVLIKDLREHMCGNEGAQPVATDTGDANIVRTEVLVLEKGARKGDRSQIETLESIW